MWDAEVDVAIAGAGGCGLIAALAAADHRLEVAVFEKTDHVLGNTVASAGMIPAAGTSFQKEHGIYETAEEMAEDIFRKNKYESDPELTIALCKVSSQLVEWMSDRLKINLSLVKEFKYPGQRNYRMHAPPSRSGMELMRGLKRNITARSNIHLLLKSQVTKLITGKNGEVIGVEVKTTNGYQKIKANKVILATNGFGGNIDMVKRFIPEISDSLYFGYEANTGDGIKMAMAIGADVSNMGAYQGHSAVNQATGVLVTWGTVMMGGFMINENGIRFGDETKGYSEFAIEVMKQPNQLGYLIFDEEIYGKLISIEDFKYLDGVNAFKTSLTIEGLAEQLGVAETSLSDTFCAFQKNTNGQSDRYGRTDFPQKLEGPFYGIKVVPALFHTQGGVKINSNAQVMTEKNIIIKNLYAGGGAAVGISGNHAYGYMSGNGLLAALGLGKIAGEHAAKAIKKERIEA
ncbi:FAD-dependent oxidoreductase [Sporosarcina ureilytica]|uniref:FAD-dependent oxidoreductase 2 FAD-binding domain-containing protein n=1 Tax=Sporosarcina ureilytica TaxID=298596 RepID=A0A1D8JFD1_9BACL|nr:FAD-dependent oxidoreductase [Sporosarcina ureilytica]AOV07415.1 hypothetical protein BI350_07600 [Sporosarcina ureilytica]